MHMGGNNENDRVPSPKSASIHLEMSGFTLRGSYSDNSIFAFLFNDV